MQNIMGIGLRIMGQLRKVLLSKHILQLGIKTATIKNMGALGIQSCRKIIRYTDL
jgi:hypothetical protein